ncbi:MAG: hemerythrin domain-containing protein [Bacteroidales bacterium]
MAELIINGQMKLSHIIESDKRALVLFPRFGIDLGFGDITVEDICLKMDIDLQFFLLMVNTFLNKDYFPDKQLRCVDVDMLIGYLVESHNFYLEERIPYLQMLLLQFEEKVDHPATTQLEKFFNQYIEEVKDHLAYEDETAFPYMAMISSYRKKSDTPLGQVDYSVGVFEERHDNIQEKLADLRNLLVKYFPPANDRYIRIRLLNELIDFEDDLINHARIEDKVLIPVVKQLEEHLKMI